MTEFTMTGPTAKVAVKKNVIKHYSVDGVQTVYLKDGTEFSLELFNPLQQRVLCKIYVNNNLISSGGLVLNPGQRVFLERYIDDSRKFKFSTYKVENTDIAQEAIKYNGQIKVEFYYENVPIVHAYNSFIEPNIWTNPYQWDYNSCIGQQVMFSSSVQSQASGTIEVNTDRCTSKSKNIETGRVDKGSESKQGFSTTYGDFNSWCAFTSYLQILPDSQRVYDVDDLKRKHYCSNCGKKVNHGDNFCSYCGHKL